MDVCFSQLAFSFLGGGRNQILHLDFEASAGDSHYLLWLAWCWSRQRCPDKDEIWHPGTSVLNFRACLQRVGEGHGTPLQYSCLENPMDGGAWWAAVHGVAKSWTRLSDFTFTFHFHFSLSCIGGGNGNPLQCSCLENPRDGGAWWAAVHAVVQSRTRLK